MVYETSPSDHETWSGRCHVEIHADFTSIFHSHTYSIGPSSVVGRKRTWTGSAFSHHWGSRALSLMCEVALSDHLRGIYGPYLELAINIDRRSTKYVTGWTWKTHTGIGYWLIIMMFPKDLPGHWSGPKTRSLWWELRDKGLVPRELPGVRF